MLEGAEAGVEERDEADHEAGDENGNALSDRHGAVVDARQLDPPEFLNTQQ